MKVFKFGGASVRSAQAVRNMSDIIGNYSGESLLVVVSAMGKTTNALENILHLKISAKDYSNKLKELYNYHQQLIEELFEDPKQAVFQKVEALFRELEQELKSEMQDQNQLYDQVVSYGELLSTTILAAWLNHTQLSCEWLDARHYIRTNELYREAEVDWTASKEQIQADLPPILSDKIILTQGFIGGNEKGLTTTLGREGSDFTAAIFGYCLQAESVTIWKDVPGILNADPKRIANAVKYEELSYQEAAEMTYYGASVIHPQTIKPLANADIPLWVKSFENPGESGTCIHNCETKHSPAIIFKDNQCLISFRVKDFTFINERNLGLIFQTLDHLHIKINMMQNSAISFSVCIDDEPVKVNKLLRSLQDEFDILYNERLQLITIKNYQEEALEGISQGRKVLLEQRSRQNFQIVIL